MRERLLLSWALALAMAVPLAAAAGAAAQAEPSTHVDTDWRQIARQDVLGAYDSYVANHPGMHDPGNRDFPDLLKRARDAGLEAADGASSPESYAAALGAFSAIIQDGHAIAGMKTPAGTPQPVEWPGFIVAWRGDKALVHRAGSATLPPPGSDVLGCDGMDIREFITTRLRARPFRPAEAGQWWYWGPRAFTSTPTFREGRPRSCTFALPNGETRSVDLAWSPAPPEFDSLLGKATDGERTPIGLSELRPGLFLIGMSDFQPNEEGVKAYRALYSELALRRDELRKARAVVIDLRFNNGGSSEWSQEGAKVLWGKAIVEQRVGDYFKTASIWWRASEGNTAYMAELVADLRRDGQAEIADDMEAAGAGMHKALASGQPFYVEKDDKADNGAPVVAANSDFTTPVYVITRGLCASACLDAVDIFTRFPNVKLIGAPTAADTTYMDVRVADLPSGKGRVVIPNKMWVGRPRASGQIYEPNIRVTDLDWSTATFLDHIERDLEGR